MKLNISDRPFDLAQSLSLDDLSACVGRSHVMTFRCAACGQTRKITADGFKELREAGEWRCTNCGGTSLELCDT